MTISPIAKQVLVSNTLTREMERCRKEANEKVYAPVPQDPMEHHKRIMSVFEKKEDRR